MLNEKHCAVNNGSIDIADLCKTYHKITGIINYKKRKQAVLLVMLEVPLSKLIIDKTKLEKTKDLAL